jgi:hypothetical protein
MLVTNTPSKVKAQGQETNAWQHSICKEIVRRRYDNHGSLAKGVALVTIEETTHDWA